jgi:hypothetical protein
MYLKQHLGRSECKVEDTKSYVVGYGLRNIAFRKYIGVSNHCPFTVVHCEFIVKVDLAYGSIWTTRVVQALYSIVTDTTHCLSLR